MIYESFSVFFCDTLTSQYYYFLFDLPHFLYKSWVYDSWFSARKRKINLSPCFSPKPTLITKMNITSNKCFSTSATLGASEDWKMMLNLQSSKHNTSTSPDADYTQEFLHTSKSMFLNCILIFKVFSTVHLWVWSW